MKEEKKPYHEERILLAAAQSGDSEALMALIGRYEPLLRRATNQPHLAAIRDDARAESYVSFVRAVRDYDAAQGVPFAGFIKARIYGDLHTLFRRTCRVWQREAVVDDRRDEAFWELIEDPAAERAMTRLERQATLTAAMRTLTARERSVIQRLFFEERTQKETAAELSITQQAVAATKRRALAKLKSALEHAGTK